MRKYFDSLFSMFFMMLLKQYIYMKKKNSFSRGRVLQEKYILSMGLLTLGGSGTIKHFQEGSASKKLEGLLEGRVGISRETIRPSKNNCKGIHILIGVQVS